jgi:hypothetical protein
MEGGGMTRPFLAYGLLMAVILTVAITMLGQPT